MAAYGLSDAEWLRWLRADGEARCVLVEADAWSTTWGLQTHTLANFPFVTRPSDSPANTIYDERVASFPQFEARLSELFFGRSTFSTGALDLDNSDGALDSWLEDGWDGRPVRLYLGSPSWPRAEFRPILTGAIADIEALDRNRLSLKLRDKTAAINVPAQTNLVGGATANKDQVIPLCFGQCFNVEPVLIDAATHRYQVHDGVISGITAVRDNGIGVAFTPNLAAGTFTLSAQPAGRITADVQGAAPSGAYLTTAAALVQHLITTRSALTTADLDAPSVAAFGALCPQTLGLYVRERRNLVELIDDLVASVGGWWGFDRTGRLRLGRLDLPGGTPVLTLTADDIDEGEIRLTRRELPPATLRLGYARNWTPQPDGLAGAVTEANRALFAAPTQIAKATQAVKAKHLLASEPDVVDTLLALSAEADAEAARRIALRTQIRTVTSLVAMAAPHFVSLGDIVHLAHPRFGYALGALAVVVGIRDRTLANRVELDLWH